MIYIINIFHFSSLINVLKTLVKKKNYYIRNNSWMSRAMHKLIIKLTNYFI